MKARLLISLLAAACCGPWVESAEPVGLKHDVHDGYFVSNKFEPNAAESYLVISTQEQFDQVFGAAFVMGDRAHRLPEKAFEKLMVLAVVKRGKAMVEYQVKAVEAVDGVVQLHYTAARTPQASAEFACPLIVSIPKGDYRAVRFIEGKQPVKTHELGGNKP